MGSMQLPEKKIKQFQKKILTWYRENKRDLPWRRKREPYAIFISEIMSQQTQISRVVPKFEAWMKNFPTVESLAAAPVSEVLHYWSGLGYNRRALNLKKTVEIIVKNFNGKFPITEKELLQLPGIGKYTARAILCFAFNQQVAVVDTNIRKIMVTQFDFDGNEKELYIFAEQLLPKNKADEWNQALMDYAASVLKKEKISIPRQSKFIGSHRYYRGQVLKYLLEHEKIELKNLGALIKKDYSELDEVWLQKLVQELIKEGFIVKKKDAITLVS
jgi:A/G-specific adenine glycosylase